MLGNAIRNRYRKQLANIVCLLQDEWPHMTFSIGKVGGVENNYWGSIFIYRNIDLSIGRLIFNTRDISNPLQLSHPKIYGIRFTYRVKSISVDRHENVINRMIDFINTYEKDQHG